MASILEPRNRIVIPRWRSFNRGAGNSEVIILKPNQVSGVNVIPFIQDKLQDWSNERTISNAVELVNAAYSLGLNEYGVDAAKFLLSTEREFSRTFQLILYSMVGDERSERTDGFTDFDFSNFFEVAGVQIRDIRHKLKENFNNPLLWTVLARYHAIFGNIEKAKKAIDIALRLTSYSNSYVQRIASRFYYHLGEVDKALSLIRRSKNYDVDPWLVSTDVAYSTKLGRFNRNLTLGMKMIDSGTFSSRDLTELASSIGTVQLQKGSLKQARKSFGVSMRQPNENSFAQVEFVSGVVEIIPHGQLVKCLQSIPDAFEARAHEFDSSGMFGEAFKNGCRWLLDQPFSKRAAIFTQHLAITKLEDYDKGIEIGKFALHSNPQSFEIMNNLAFAFSKKRKFNEAAYFLERMRSLNPNDYFRTFLLATEGLLRMRQGNLVEGKKLYDLSIQHAIEKKLPDLKDLAIYNYLLESFSATGMIDHAYITQLQKTSRLRRELERKLKML